MKKQNPEIRIVINQAGAFIELHNYSDKPVMIGKLSQSALEQHRADAIRKNPDMKYAAWGQFVQATAQEWFESVRHHYERLTLSPSLWEYNASTDKYSRA